VWKMGCSPMWKSLYVSVEFWGKFWFKNFNHCLGKTIMQLVACFIVKAHCPLVLLATWVPLESHWWIGSCWGDFVMFRPMKQNLSYFEWFFNWNFKWNKILYCTRAHPLGTIDKSSMSRVAWRWFSNF
jgi:hypothetical protein